MTALDEVDEIRALLRLHPGERETRHALYVGVRNDLVRRGYEHRSGMVPGFTLKYRVHTLVYFEMYEDVRDAIGREKRLKRWRRTWKIDLIESHNEDWHDLWPTLAAGGG